MRTTHQQEISPHVWHLCYFFLLLMIALLAYSRVLQFTFYLDDWAYFWKAQYHVQTLLLMFLQWGTTLEFFFLTRIFGQHVVMWQLFGIVLKAAAAYAVGLMVSTVTRIRRAGILAGIFFACLPIGIQTVSWISAHVVDIDVIGSSVTFLLWVRFHRTGLKKFLWYTVGAGLLALALDPVRILPLILMLGMYSLVSPAKMKQSNVSLIRALIGVLCVIILIVAVWERQYIIISPPYAMLFRFHHTPSPVLLWHGARLVANYFWSLFNLVFGAFMTPVTMAPHPVFHIETIAASAAIFLFTLLYSTYVWFKKRDETGFFALLFTSWMLLFFIPCWIFEPRQMVEPAHRYLVLPSVGLVGLLGYFVAKLKHISLVSIAAVVIIAVNIIASNRLLSFENIYRSRALTEHFWKTIDATVGKNEFRSIFVFQGEEPVRTWTFELSGSGPFALSRKISDAGRIPMVTTDKEKILHALCKSHESSTQTIPLSHVHAWFVKNNGAITDISSGWRDTLRTILIDRQCEFEE